MKDILKSLFISAIIMYLFQCFVFWNLYILDILKNQNDIQRAFLFLIYTGVTSLVYLTFKQTKK